jgi:hypothetical protein
VYREVRRAPSLSGPLMLPNRASANSLSAPIKPTGGNEIIQNESKIFIIIVTAVAGYDLLTQGYRFCGINFFSLIGFRESLDDKSKANLVQIKGRFSVTSENLDLVKVRFKMMVFCFSLSTFSQSFYCH